MKSSPDHQAHEPSDDDEGAPNPSRLPVEPEFAPQLPPPDAQEPGASPAPA